ncbi:MAG: hypothetical protein GX446_11485 [Chthonomonadales bacterium]|nr:hypothetical protein [Chthonomonadales bacterium]
MPPAKGGSSASSEGSKAKLALVVVIVVLAIAAAVFSIGRTIKKSQGENMGSLGGLPSKGELMKEQGVEPPAGSVGSGMEGPSSSGREGPSSGTILGGKGSSGL